MKRAHQFVLSLATLASWCSPWAISTALAEQRPTPADLPSTAQARQGIEQDPSVAEARDALVAAGHGAAALRAGSYEWTTRLSAQRRRYDGGGNSSEWAAALERAVRIGGKAEIDTALGDSDMAIGRARLAEARHTAARALADMWLDLQATRRQRELWADQLNFAQASQQAVEKRHKAGDASMLDLNAANADLIDVQRQSSAAATAEAKSQARLAVRFPGLPHDALPLTEPAALDMGLAQWRARILEQSDAIKVAEGWLKKAELGAARTKADRIPDPTVGIYTASEAFRRERIVGLSVSIPLSGSYRSERMHQALQEAEAARATVERLKRDEEVSIVDTFADATGGLERWRLTAQGLSKTRDSARLTQRAYALGETDLQTLLLARRQALEASTAAEQARVDALRAHYRLLVDAHLIWGMEED
ncbi:MAG: TolC family protein [Burkholderiaceae bacterium]|nr:TolC family protein [Burkholderiaceae bacterium]